MAPVLNIRVFDDHITINPIGPGSGNVVDDELLPDIFVRVVFMTNGSYHGHLTVRHLRDAEIEIPWPDGPREHIVELYAEEELPSGLLGELHLNSRLLVANLTDAGKRLLTILDAQVNQEREIRLEDVTHIRERGE